LSSAERAAIRALTKGTDDSVP